VVAGAVGFDKAAVGGLTAAVLLDLALELLQGGASHAVHLLPWWWLAVGGASVLGWGSGFAPAHPAPGWGTLGSAGGHRSPRLAFVGGLVGVGDLQGAGRAQPDDDVGLGVLLGRADVASTSAAVAVELPHNGHGRGTDLVALIGAPRLGFGSGRRWC
jgi:hypothetical protein